MSHLLTSYLTSLKEPEFPDHKLGKSTTSIIAVISKSIKPYFQIKAIPMETTLITMELKVYKLP